MCRLYDFITSSVVNIITHVLNFHNIDINSIDDTNNLDGYILNKFKFMCIIEYFNALL